MLRQWAAAVGCTETRLASHSMREIFVRGHLDRGARLRTLMHAIGHSSERQTLQYAGILDDGQAELYAQPI